MFEMVSTYYLRIHNEKKAPSTEVENTCFYGIFPCYYTSYITYKSTGGLCLGYNHYLF
jgi:hypothetical protein